MWQTFNLGKIIRRIACCCRAVNALANDPEFYLEKVLEPGDMTWLANHSAFHARGPLKNVSPLDPKLEG